MLELQNKQVLVIGLSSRGWAACEFLRRSGAKVVGVDHADSHDLRRGADRLRPLGIEVALGVSAPPEREFNLAILSSALPKRCCEAMGRLSANWRPYARRARGHVANPIYGSLLAERTKAWSFMTSDRYWRSVSSARSS